jgi:hypothetical protein
MFKTYEERAKRLVALMPGTVGQLLKRDGMFYVGILFNDGCNRDTAFENNAEDAWLLAYSLLAKYRCKQLETILQENLIAVKFKFSLLHGLKDGKDCFAVVQEDGGPSWLGNTAEDAWERALIAVFYCRDIKDSLRELRPLANALWVQPLLGVSAITEPGKRLGVSVWIYGGGEFLHWNAVTLDGALDAAKYLLVSRAKESRDKLQGALEPYLKKAAV